MQLEMWTFAALYERFYLFWPFLFFIFLFDCLILNPFFFSPSFMLSIQPSHGDKTSNPEVLKWMNDLAKGRKQLKGT